MEENVFKSTRSRFFHNILCLFVIVLSVSYFSELGISPLSVVFFPFLFSLYYHEIYEQINYYEIVRRMFKDPKYNTETDGKSFEEMIRLVWPYFFSKEYREYYISILQSNVEGYEDLPAKKIRVKEMKVGSKIPSIKISIPQQNEKNSVVLNLTVDYDDPDFDISTSCSFAILGDFAISIQKLKMTLYLEVKFQFNKYLDKKELPSLIEVTFFPKKAPVIHNLGVLNTSLIDTRLNNACASLKKWIHEVITTSLEKNYGFVWDHINHRMTQAVVNGRVSLERIYINEFDISRISRIKTLFMQRVAEYRIPKPLVLITKSYQEKKTCTSYIEKATELLKSLKQSPLRIYFTPSFDAKKSSDLSKKELKKCISNYGDEYLKCIDTMRGELAALSYELSSSELIHFLSCTFNFVLEMSMSFSSKDMCSTKHGLVLNYSNFVQTYANRKEFSAYKDNFSKLKEKITKTS